MESSIRLTEAPLKRKLEDPSDGLQCKKPRDCLTSVEPTLEHPQGATESDNDKLNSTSVAVKPVEATPNPISAGEEVPKGQQSAAKFDELEPSIGVSGPSSVVLEKHGHSEAIVTNKEIDDETNDQLGSEGEIDSEDEDEYEADDGDSDEEEESSENLSDDEGEQEHTLSSTSRSLQDEAAWKSKGKEKIDDIKGKGILALDKDKGKAIAEDDTSPDRDEDDAGYLSEDPLQEVDLNNILPTRTRKRNINYDYNTVNDVGDNDDDDDEDDDFSYE
ncbi:hypothetical protein KP509_13G004300 [Ceratopteris richardii]|nr:hypothetical protein KP509_13G004300 [Ceratopteris richardii]